MAEAGSADRVGERSIAPQVEHLGVAKGGLDRAVVGGLEKPVADRPRHREGQIGRGPQAFSCAEMDKPCLLARAPLRPHPVEEVGEIVGGEQMPGERCKLTLGVVRGRAPIGEVADPLGLVGEEGDEPGGQLRLLFDRRRCGDVHELGNEPVGSCRAAGGQGRPEGRLPSARGGSVCRFPAAPHERSERLGLPFREGLVGGGDRRGGKEGAADRRAVPAGVVGRRRHRGPGNPLGGSPEGMAMDDEGMLVGRKGRGEASLAEAAVKSGEAAEEDRRARDERCKGHLEGAVEEIADRRDPSVVAKDTLRIVRGELAAVDRIDPLPRHVFREGKDVAAIERQPGPIEARCPVAGHVDIDPLGHRRRQSLPHEAP